MADILIRMEMPQSCSDCPMCYDMIECTVSPLRFWYGRPENEQFDFCNERHPACPLVELPEHGDLIDRDAFRAENEYYLNREFINPKYEDTLDDLLKDAPVVIPSNKEESE